MTTSAPACQVRGPGAEVTAKRAAKVADLIVEDVTALGWPVGEVLGSEADLLERYHVSRAEVREAVRLVEHQQVARTRRGPGGGLVVTEPTIGAVSDAVVVYLHRVEATLDEIFETRIILEEIACELAAERTDGADLAALRRFADHQPLETGGDPRDLHALVAAVSRNAGVELFVDVFHHVTRLYAPDRQKHDRAIAHETAHAHAGIAQAVVTGHSGLASRRIREHLQTEVAALLHRRSTRQLFPHSVVLAESARGKGAETVARSITGMIAAQKLQPGDLVGTEPELIPREGVSRALLREAVRLLEYHQIARMRRGPGGGLFVIAPGAGAVTETAAIYLARRGMQPPDAQLLTRVEVALADLAAQRIDADGTALLRDALRQERTVSRAERGESVPDLHAAVAASAHNRVLELVALVMIGLGGLRREGLAGRHRRESEEVLRTHEGIAGAIEAGDRELARHRMRRHLQVLGGPMR